MLRYAPLSAENYIRNRKAFADALVPGALALFSSNDTYPTGADGTLPFRQDSNMLHMCGVDQEETVLLVFPHAHNPAAQGDPVCHRNER